MLDQQCWSSMETPGCGCGTLGGMRQMVQDYPNTAQSV